MSRQPLSELTRRDLLKTAVSGVAMASLPSLANSASTDTTTPVKRKGRIQQSVSRWCYQKIELDKLCAYAAEIGLKAIDLLNPDEYEVPK